MGPRKLYFLLAGMLGAALAVLPSLAAGSSASSTASFKAIDFAWQARGGGNQVTIAPGDTVNFSYPSPHGPGRAPSTLPVPTRSIATCTRS